MSTGDAVDARADALPMCRCILMSKEFSAFKRL